MQKKYAIISDEDYAALEKEFEHQPLPQARSTLEVAWDSFINQPGASTGGELALADLSSGKLYSIYAQPATDVSGNRIVIYPIAVRYVNDYGSAETFEALPDGSFNWKDIEQKYFPGGFTPVEKNTDQETITSAKKIPDGFWYKVLSNLLHNFSAKSFYSKHLDNPYIVKKNK